MQFLLSTVFTVCAIAAACTAKAFFGVMAFYRG
jgi:hypothetical protein